MRSDRLSVISYQLGRGFGRAPVWNRESPLNELLDAIFKHNSAAVRVQARSNSAHMSTKTDAGTFPADVARELGDAEAFVALIRAGAPSILIPTTADAWARLFVDYVQWFCSSYFAATWLTDIEFDLWEAVKDVPGWRSRGKLLALDEHRSTATATTADIIGDLSFLRSRCSGWPHYESPNRWATADRWDALYETWLIKRRPR